MTYIGLFLTCTGKLLQNIWQLFVIFKLTKTILRKLKCWSLIYVLGKYFNSLNVSNDVAKYGKAWPNYQIYCTCIMIYMCCTLVPCSVYWCLAVLISLCGISLWCLCKVFMVSVDLKLMISVIFVHCTARARRMIVKRR